MSGRASKVERREPGVESDLQPSTGGVRLPSASVVIPARDAAGPLRDCLQALLGERRAEVLEVIVVDDGSCDATAQLARAAGARVLRLDGRGPAAARNAGARAAEGEALLFFDADCVPEPNCPGALLAALADPTVAGARGAYTTAQRSLVARFTQLELDEKQERLARSARIALVDTACAAYRRALFLEVGGFDERFRLPSAEDAELSFRLVERGERLVFVPAARVRHRHPERLGTYLRRKLRFGYFRARLYTRHPRRAVDDGYTPRTIPLQIALAGLLTLAGLAGPLLGSWRPAAWVGAAFVASAMPMARRAWAADRPLALLVPALALARALAQGLGLASGLAALAGEAALRVVRMPEERSDAVATQPMDEGKL